MGATFPLPRGTGAGSGADHSPQSKGEIKDGGAIPPVSSMPSWYSP